MSLPPCIYFLLTSVRVFFLSFFSLRAIGTELIMQSVMQTTDPEREA